MAKSDVELVIRARNEASKTLNSISSALEAFTQQQKRAAGEIDESSSSLDRLAVELDQLRKSTSQLREISKLGRDMAELGKQIDAQRDKAAKAARAYHEIAAEMAKAEAPSKRLQQQFERKARAVEQADAKLGEMERHLSDLTRESRDAQAAVGLLGASQEKLAGETDRASRAQDSLQAELAATKRLAKGALDGLDVGAVAGLEPVAQGVAELGEAIHEAGQQSDLSVVDFKALTQQINELETAAKSLGDLRQIAAAFGDLREQAQQLNTAWQQSQAQTDKLAAEFAEAATPSRDLARALGESRAMTARLEQDFKTAETNVASLGNALREAGVDTARLGDAQQAVESQISSVAATVANSRVALDRLSDAQKVQAAERKQAAKDAEDAQRRADAAAQREADNLRRSREAAKGALQAYRQTSGAVDEARQAFAEASAEAARLGQAVAQTEQPTATMLRQFDAAQARAADLRQNYHALAQSAGRLGGALSSTRFPDTATPTDSAARIDAITDAQQDLARATQDSTTAVTRFNSEQDTAALARRREETDRLAQATRQLASATRARDLSSNAVPEAAAQQQAAAQQVARLATAMRKGQQQVAELTQQFEASQAATHEADQAYREAQQTLGRLAQQINGTAAPTQEMVEQFEAAKREVNDLEREFKDQTKTTGALRKVLEGAEKSVASLGDEYARAEARGSQLAASATEIRAAYAALEAAIRDNADDVNALAAAEQRLEKALKGRGEALVASSTAFEKSERRLRDFAQASERAGREAQELGRDTRALGDDMVDVSRDIRRAESSLADFRDQGRTTLSLYQRLRGQVLALTSAYIGLYGVGAGVTGIAQSQMSLEAAQARLQVAVGDDPTAVAEQLEFVNRVADDLSINLEAATEGYSKFATSAKLAGASTEEAQAMFIGLSKAARVNKLTADESARAMRAFEQTMSKGKVSSEELKEQLGDVIPGSLGLMKEAIQDARGEVEELSDEAFYKLLENGQIGADAMILFAAKLEEKFGPAVAAALTSTSAKIEDFRNSLTRLRLVVAQSGFIDALGDALQDVTEALSAPGAQQGARRLGEALGNVVRWFGSLVEHANTAILVLKLLGAALAIKWTVNLVAGLATGIASLRTFIAQTRLATVAVRMFGAFLGWLGLLFAAFSIAEWAAREFPAFGEYWYAFRESIDRGLAEVVLAFQRAGVQISDGWGNMLQVLGNLMAQWIAKDLKIIATLFDGVEWLAGGEGMHFGDAIREAADGLSAEVSGGLSEEAQAELDELQAAHEETLAAVADKWRKAREEIGVLGPNLTPEGQEGGEYTGINIADVLGDLPSIDDILLSGDGGNKAAKQLADRMTQELDRVQDRLAELTADTLEERLALVRREFADLLAYLKAVGNEAGVETVESLIAILQTQEKITFQQEKNREHQDGINDLLQYRRDLMEMISFYEKEGDAEAVKELRERLNEVNREAEAAIDNAIAMWRAIGGPEAEAAILALQKAKVELADVEVQMDLLSAKNLGETFGQHLIRGTDNFLAKIRETGDAIGSLKEAFRQFASDFLLRIAQMILQQAIFNALQAMGGGGGGGFLQGLTAGVQHDGGIAGASTNTTRSVPAAWFANAVRYHGGGIAGLKPGEVPSILERGEEVLTRDDPRHVANGGKGGGGGSQPVNVKNVNVFDSADVLNQALADVAGQKVLLNFVRSNRSAFRGAMGS